MGKWTDENQVRAKGFYPSVRKRILFLHADTHYTWAHISGKCRGDWRVNPFSLKGERKPGEWQLNTVNTSLFLSDACHDQICFFLQQPPDRTYCLLSARLQWDTAWTSTKNMQRLMTRHENKNIPNYIIQYKSGSLNQAIWLSVYKHCIISLYNNYVWYGVTFLYTDLYHSVTNWLFLLYHSSNTIRHNKERIN